MSTKNTGEASSGASCAHGESRGASCAHGESCGASCAHGESRGASSTAGVNCRLIYFTGAVTGHQKAIAQVVHTVIPSAELEWEGNALTITAPEADGARLPLALRGISKWLREHAPEVQRSYTAPIALDEEEDDEAGEGGFLSRQRTPMLIVGTVVFALTLAISRWLPEVVSICLYVISYLFIGQDIILNFLKGLRGRKFLDETFLMTVASLGAFAIGEWPEAVAVMLFYQVGEAFQRRAVGRSRQSIAAMMNLRPDTACLQTDGGEAMVAPEEVAVGEVIAVKPGERIPLDGVVVEGHTMLDTSALTGESLPREVNPGDEALSGSICQTGRILLKVTRPFCESTLSRILELVQHAGSRKTPTERFITIFSRYYTPAVVGGALVLAVLPPLLGGEWTAWIHRALVFLVVSCPCALVISVPLSYFGGIGAASCQNILVKGSACLDALAKVSTVVFDKTGTLTRGAFQVQEITPAPGFSREELLSHAAHVEYASNHPIAMALRRAAPRPLDTKRVTELEEFAGHGVKAKLDGRTILAGNYRFLRENRVEEVSSRADGTVVHVAVEGRYAGAITIADQLKPDSALAIQALRREGVRNIQMLTGDHQAVAEETAAMLGLDGFHAELLPAQKVELVEELESHKPAGTKVAFVGDGINDAPVLARADLGIAMGGMGADAAVAAADAVLMTDRPSQIAIAIRIARKTLAIVRQNIVFALGVKALILTLGALGYANLWLAVFGDVGVAVLATLNATRTLRTGKIRELYC